MASETDKPGGASKRLQFTLKGLLYFVTFLAAVLGASRALGPRVSLEFVGFFEAAIVVAALVALLTPIEGIRRSSPAYADPFVSLAVTILAAVSFLTFDLLTTRVHIQFDPAAAFVVFVVFFVVVVIMTLAAADVVPPREDVRLSPYPHAGNVIRALGVRRFRFRLIVGTSIILALYTLSVAARYSDGVMYRVPLSPPPIAGICLAFWGLLWLADSWTRPGKIGIGALPFWLCIAAIGVSIG